MVHKKSQVCVPLPQSVNWLKSVFIKKNRKQYIFIYRYERLVVTRLIYLKYKKWPCG